MEEEYEVVRSRNLELASANQQMDQHIDFLKSQLQGLNSIQITAEHVKNEVILPKDKV